MQVYNEETSTVARIVSGVTAIGWLCAYGLICASTNSEIFSVIEPHADTIGLPGGGIWFLCILGSR
jgi:hypothetical protein